MKKWGTNDGFDPEECPSSVKASVGAERVVKRYPCYCVHLLKFILSIIIIIAIIAHIMSSLEDSIINVHVHRNTMLLKR